MTVLLAMSCTNSADPSPQGPPTTTGPPNNVLLVVIDDIGIDRMGMYGIATDPVPLPTLDRLAAEGVVFDQAWASPTCTPSRASMLTGRHPRRTGAGTLVDMRKDAWALSEDSWTLPKALLAAPDDWSSAAIGKWHLAGEQAPEFLDHPLASGFGRTAGSPGYLVINTRTGEDGYFHWLKNDDGTAAFSDVYNTTDVVDEALLAAAEMPEPWFLWVAFNAAHEPLHVPPPELHDRDVTESSPDGDLHDAVAQAMDTELDRLLAGIDDERLTVVVVGDNGTPDFVADPEVVTPSEGKGTIHEGGVRVPLLIRTPDVADPGRHSDALVHVVDLFPTLLQAAGVPLQQDPGGLSVASPLGPTALDGLSLLPILEDASARLGRDILYTERLEPNGPPPWSDWGRALRDPSWKLEVRASGNVDLHRLGPGLDEGPDLLDAGTLDADALDAFDRLMAALAVQDARLVYEGR